MRCSVNCRYRATFAESRLQVIPRHVKEAHRLLSNSILHVEEGKVDLDIEEEV